MVVALFKIVNMLMFSHGSNRRGVSLVMLSDCGWGSSRFHVSKPHKLFFCGLFSRECAEGNAVNS